MNPNNQHPVYKNTIIYGKIGSGKTSFLYNSILKDLLDQGCTCSEKELNLFCPCEYGDHKNKKIVMIEEVPRF